MYILKSRIIEQVDDNIDCWMNVGDEFEVRVQVPRWKLETSGVAIEPAREFLWDTRYNSV